MSSTGLTAAVGAEAKGLLIADFTQTGAVRRRILWMKSGAGGRIPLKYLIFCGYFMAGHGLSTP
jgi:hypothetical protein